MRLKIVSDGTPANTHVVDAATGEKVNGIVAIEWRIDSPTKLSEATITIRAMEIDVIGAAATIHTRS
jgi:hypothetical protein